MLPLLPCQVQVDLSDLPRIEAVADCLAEVETGAPVFSLGGEMVPREVLSLGGGVSVFPSEVGGPDGLTSWTLPALPDGTYRLRIRYGGVAGTMGAAGWQASLGEGLFPLGSSATGCAILRTSPAGSGPEPMAGDARVGDGGRLFCSEESQILLAQWAAFADPAHPGMALFPLEGEPHPSWFRVLSDVLAEGEALAGPRRRSGLLVAEGPRPHAEAGLIVLPAGTLALPPDPLTLSRPLASQWLAPGTLPEKDALGRWLLPQLGWGTLPLAARLSDRARLDRSAALRLSPSPLLVETARLASSPKTPDCGEGSPWPRLAVERMEVPFLRHGGYELSVSFEWTGRCPVDLIVEIRDENHAERVVAHLEPGRSTLLFPLGWRPLVIILDPDALFLGRLPRDAETSLLADLEPDAFQEWVQPLGIPARLGPSGASWPVEGEIRLPDGTRLPWTADSLFVASGGGEGWVATPVAGVVDLGIPEEMWQAWGWVFLEGGSPRRWGTQPAGSPLRLPPPDRFPWGNR